VDDRFNPL